VPKKMSVVIAAYGYEVAIRTAVIVAGEAETFADFHC
jgi:hypothetical protein